jgi:hypothetical protein
MKVLVSASSKYGATSEIAQAVAVVPAQSAEAAPRGLATGILGLHRRCYRHSHRHGTGVLPCPGIDDEQAALNCLAFADR